MRRPNIIGGVLAGGQGRRFGGAKDAAVLDGRSLASHAAAALAAAGIDVVLAIHQGQELPADVHDVSVVYDVVAGAGPLGGLHAILDWMSADWALILTCDQPFLQGPLLERLCRDRDGDHQAVVVNTRRGLQPFPGLYRKTCLNRVSEALNKGELAMHRLLDSLDAHVLGADALADLDPDQLSFININTREELDCASARVRNARGTQAPRSSSDE